MQITIHGAGGGEVTGSAYLVRTTGGNVLIDCGLFQGAKKIENLNRRPTRDIVKKLDAVVLTHAGQSDLLHWFNTLAPSRPRVVLTHGEDRARKPLGRLIQEHHGIKVEYPALEDTITA